MTVLHFTTVRDVAPQMSGHLDRFKTHEAFAAACRLVWIAAEHSGQGAMIDQQKADAIMNRAIEEETRKGTEFAAYLRQCTDAQVQGVYDKERAAGRGAYVMLALAEAARRGLTTLA